MGSSVLSGFCAPDESPSGRASAADPARPGDGGGVQNAGRKEAGADQGGHLAALQRLQGGLERRSLRGRDAGGAGGGRGGTEQAGVRLSMHQLRKGFGCRVAKTLGKGNAPVLHELMRHSSMQITMDYATVDDVLQDAINQLT